MTCLNFSGFNDCAPSLHAASGLLCTSTISPSAPAAIAARLIDSIHFQFPVAWEGSMMIGRCVFSLMIGTTLRSNVFLVYFSNVRIPRSQRMTFSFPPAIIYSADMIHSSIVLESPLFNKIGFWIFPTAFRREKFCIFLAPIWIRSTCSTNSSICSASISSLTIGSPVCLLASTISLIPSVSSPWNAYGEVRGLYAPPLNISAPAAFTSFAISQICSLLSTEHGPPMTTIFSWPPIFTPATSTTVSSGWNIRFAFLYGAAILVTSETSGLAWIIFSSRLVVSPISPKIW